MTEKETQDARCRKAARELTKPLRRKLAYAERTINSLVQKLEIVESDNLELKRKIARIQNG